MLRTRFPSKLCEQRADTFRTERVARAISKWGLSSERKAKDKVRGTRRKHPSHDRIQISRRGTRDHFRRGLGGGSKTPISICLSKNPKTHDPRRPERQLRYSRITKSYGNIALLRFSGFRTGIPADLRTAKNCRLNTCFRKPSRFTLTGIVFSSILSRPPKPSGFLPAQIVLTLSCLKKDARNRKIDQHTWECCSRVA
jgi:hypothetical protein